MISFEHLNFKLIWYFSFFLLNIFSFIAGSFEEYSEGSFGDYDSVAEEAELEFDQDGLELAAQEGN